MSNLTSLALPSSGISFPTVETDTRFHDVRTLHQNEIVQSDDSIVPHFDAMTGELRFRGKVIREYALRAKNCIAVLEAFEEQGWPQGIYDPLPGGKKAPRLNNTVRSLNDGLHEIRFHAGGTAESFRWKLATNGEPTVYAG